MMPTAEDFRVTLRARMQGAEQTSKTPVEINSGQLHRQVGGYPVRVPVERDHGFRWKVIIQSGGR